MLKLNGLNLVLLLCLIPAMVTAAETETQEETSRNTEFGVVSFKGVNPTVTVMIDEQSYGQAGLLGPIMIRTGEHTFTFGDDGVPIRIKILGGKTTYVAEHLPTLEPQTASGQTLSHVVSYYEEPTKTKAGLLLTGAGVLTLGVGLAMGYAAVGVAEESQGLKRDQVLRSEYDSIVEATQSQVAGANVLLVSGGAMLLSGLTTLYLEGYFEGGKKQ